MLLFKGRVAIPTPVKKPSGCLPPNNKHKSAKNLIMESNIEGIKKFFDKIGLINFKYEEVLNDQQYNFNVFSIVRNDCDEVNLHSRFLYEILNPNGSHKKGDIFLQLFLSGVGLSDFITTETSTIFEKEYERSGD